MESKKWKSDKSKLIKKYLLNLPVDNYESLLGKKSRGSGIYALYKNGSLYYVGLSKSSSRARIRAHALRDRHKGLWDSCSFFQIKRVRYIKDIESLLLKILMPPGNRVNGRFHKRYDLAKKLLK